MPSKSATGVKALRSRYYCSLSHARDCLPLDIQQGEIKYNKKVTENMDLSDVPETVPTLGVAAGRDRLDTANRSLVKRRPASQKQSLLLDSTEDKIMGTGRVDLSQMADNKVSLSFLCVSTELATDCIL